MIPKPTKGISVDAMAAGNPGPAKYRGIDLETGEVLFTVDIGISTNNIAEYLAVCHAVLHCLKNDRSTTIYTDSQTAISWVKSGNPNTTLTRCEKTEKGLNYLDRAKIEMKKYPVNTLNLNLIINGIVFVSKWYKTEWGEPPADFGEKIIYGKRT